MQTTHPSRESPVPPGAAAGARALAATVSVVIPTYNRAALCARAVRSALAQTLPPCQIIVVDDGSTDDTRERLQQEFGEHVQLIAQANQGVSAARNAGAAAARGKYIAFLDSDDLWSPEKLARQVAWLEARPDYAMVLCDLAVVRPDGSAAPPISRRGRLPSDGRILKDVLKAPALIPSSMLILRETFEALQGFDTSLRTAEDLDFHMRAAARASIGLIELPLVTITQGDSTGLSALDRTNRDHVFAVSRFIAQNRHLIGPEDARSALFKVLRYNAWSAASGNRPAEGLGFAVRALRHVAGPADLLSVASLAPLIGKVAIKRALNSLRPAGR